MIRIVDLHDDRTATEPSIADSLCPPPPGVVRWIDLQAPDEPTLHRLAGAFGLHPLAIEDCLHVNQRAKLEDFDGHLFLVMHGFVAAASDRLRSQELHAFLGAEWLLTVRDEAMAPVDEVRRRLIADPSLGRRGADFVYYLVADQVVDVNFGHIDTLSELLEGLEEAVLEQPEPAIMQRLFRVKRTLVQMRRTLAPQRDIFAILAKRGAGIVSERSGPYYRDIYDHLVRIGEAIEAARDILGNVIEAYLSMVAQRTNEVMKRLTILSAIFLPLTFITGFFGQNFDVLPHASRWAPWVVTGLCLVIPAGMLVWFRLRRWM